MILTINNIGHTKFINEPEVYEKIYNKGNFRIWWCDKRMNLHKKFYIFQATVAQRIKNKTCRCRDE